MKNPVYVLNILCIMWLTACGLTSLGTPEATGGTTVSAGDSAIVISDPPCTSEKVGCETPTAMTPALAPGAFTFVPPEYGCGPGPDSSGIPSQCLALVNGEFKEIEFSLRITQYYDYTPVTHRILFGALEPGQGAGPAMLSANNLEMLDVTSGAVETLLAERLVVKALWAPNGRDLAYLRATDTTYELHWRFASGEDKVLAVDVPILFGIAPSGQHVAFTRESAYPVPGTPGVYIVTVADGQERKLSEVDRAGAGSISDRISWSPDGQYFFVPVGSALHLVATDGSLAGPVVYAPVLTQEPWNRPPPGVPADQFGPSASALILWHPDGHHFIGAAQGPAGEGPGEPQEVMMYDLDLATRQIVSGIALAESGQLLTWDQPGQSVWLQMVSPDGVEVRSVPLPQHLLRNATQPNGANPMVDANALAPQIELTPNPALVDQLVDIRLTGFAPDQLVILQTQMQDDANQTWVSRAKFQTDAQGVIDVSTQQPLTGTYTEVDGMGVFWSMTVMEEGREPLFFTKRSLTPLPMHFTATVADQIVSAVTLERLFVAPAVTIIPVRHQGLVATLFRPAGAGPFPGVIVLGGSEGGITSAESRAALLASHGYVALALAYFAMEHLPAALVNLPLEYFETAIHWLQAQADVQQAKLAVIGGSRGGELALLLGATFPQIKAVVAYVPSSVLWGSFGGTEQISPQCAWASVGQPLPCMPEAPPELAERIFGQEIVILAPLFLPRLEDSMLVEQAAIPVEKINGPVLLISGQDDQMWPSARMAEMVMQRLTRYNHRYPFHHLSYPGAGHLIRFPYLPTTVTQSRHPIDGRVYTVGGNAKDHAFAQLDSWARMLEFLEENLLK